MFLTRSTKLDIMPCMRAVYTCNKKDLLIPARIFRPKWLDCVYCKATL